MADSAIDLAPVDALVAASGRGERFGGHKLLARWNGREVLGHVLQTLKAAQREGIVRDIVLVYRPGDERVRALALAQQAIPVAAPETDGGLADSLRTGLQALGAREPLAGAALICLGDQPRLRLEVVRALIEDWHDSHSLAIRARYSAAPDQPGHPVLLHRSIWWHGSGLSGDQGFGSLLARRGITVRELTVNGDNPDVDTPLDLAGLDHPASPHPS